LPDLPKCQSFCGTVPYVLDKEILLLLLKKYFIILIILNKYY
jgi:hypothetical protein